MGFYSQITCPNEGVTVLDNPARSSSPTSWFSEICSNTSQLVAVMKKRPELLLENMILTTPEEHQAELAHMTRNMALFSPHLMTPDASGCIPAQQAFNFRAVIREGHSSNIAARCEVIMVTLANQLATKDERMFRPDYQEILGVSLDTAMRRRIAGHCLRIHNHMAEAMRNPQDEWTADTARRLKVQTPYAYRYWAGM